MQNLDDRVMLNATITSMAKSLKNQNELIIELAENNRILSEAMIAVDGRINRLVELNRTLSLRVNELEDALHD